MPRRTHPGRARAKAARARARRSEEVATAAEVARRRRARSAHDDFDPGRLLDGESVVRDDREARP